MLHLLGSCFLIQTTPTGQACLEELQVSPGQCSQRLLVNQPCHVSSDPLPTLLSPHLSQPTTIATSEREKTARPVKRAIIIKIPEQGLGLSSKSAQAFALLSLLAMMPPFPHSLVTAKLVESATFCGHWILHQVSLQEPLGHNYYMSAPVRSALIIPAPQSAALVTLHATLSGVLYRGSGRPN